MKDLIILGTGVHAAEMAEIVIRINNVLPTWNLMGFITPLESKVGEIYNGYPVLGTRDVLCAYPEVSLVSDNEWPFKKDIPLERLVSIVDPSSFVSRTASIGPGNVIYPNCYVGLNARTGRSVFCLSGCIINHDDVLEDEVLFASGVKLAGSVYVEENCYLGQGCNIRQYLRIGRGSLIGMGSVVVKNVDPNSVMVGNPAKKLRENTK